ncbi:flotillin family protein [Nocardia sp. NBC_01503]|uniref:SPFH domain-containing protein n=1 Tax=Nocardia sp. NBC_01503 TaxID=2975997 RepID=UPI002E7AB9E8|nr:flotillin family protein [Nocardia sp. NBC_01503]WTL30990.1 flotillin family protein [Nocardia sp. NBC_01503]
MSTIAIGLGVLLAVALLLAIAVTLIVSSLFKKVEQGRALIISKMRRVDVTFTGAVVLPVLHKAEYMDISVKTIEIARVGRDGLICRDNIRADIRITFFVRVNKTVEDVIKVAQAIGTTRASDQATLQELFAAKFSEALKTVGKHLDFVDLYTQRHEFRDRIIAVIGTDLNGYSLEDAAIDHLEQTPLNQLDAQNILDAQGIRKITELTAVEHVRTNEFRRHEEKEITRQNVQAREAVLELERQQADAENRQKREVETTRAREEAEIARVQAEERLRSQTAHLRTEEALGIQEQNAGREIAVAEKNRERVIAVESERIEKDRLLEVTARDREVELARIAADREVETEKRTVAEVVRERVAVDKTVAEQEEQINRLRAVEAAERERQAIIIRAEAQAQEHLVKDIKAAEAAEAAAKFKAKEALTLAEADQRSADMRAQAKIRLAEASQAESAAYGLGQAQVKEREADAVEKMGRAEASALREKGLVQAETLREKLKGEAEGLRDKAAAMAALDDATREHEEYRLRLESEKEVELAKVNAHREIAAAQATVLSAGLAKANIDIVGGDSVFLDRIVGSIGLGKGLDQLIGNSEVGKTAATALIGKLAGRNGSGDGERVTVK